MSNTFQYSPPGGGPETPPIPIDDNVLYGAEGHYAIHATGIAFIAEAADTAQYLSKSSFDLTIQPYGGLVALAGNWNLAIANSGTYTADDSVNGDHNNTFVAGEPVSKLFTVLQPTDQVFGIM